MSWEAIKSLLELGSGYGILPDYILNDDTLRRGLEPVELGFNAPTYELVAVTPTMRTLRRNVSLMLHHLQADGP